MDIADGRATAMTADVRLADLKTRLGKEQDVLELAALTGRVAWRSWKRGFELTSERLDAVMNDGRSLAPMNLRLRRDDASGNKPAGGELKANVLELEPLAQVAEQLPIDAEARALLKRYEPKGRLKNVTLKWSGDWPNSKFELTGSFSGLGVSAVDAYPGISNFSGTIEASERGGVLTLANDASRIELKQVLAEPLALDELSGQIRWSKSGENYDIRIGSVSFANADLAGSLQGQFQTQSEGPGIADLSAALTRADARHVARYMPLTVGKTTREWLAGALIAGQSNDVRMQLRGDLRHFPFERGGKGIFEVKARARGGILDYANGWPRIENIVADLAFVGSRMEIRASSASILGAQIARTSAVIADLKYSDELLEVNGEAEGATSEFLRFIAESPVAAMIDRFTDGMEAQGRGRLGLRLTLPLRTLKDTRIAGNFQFINNRLLVDPDLSPLEQVNGRLEFTESAVRATNITAQIFGGDVAFNVAGQGSTILVNAGGRANMDQLRGTTGGWAKALSGQFDWRGVVTVRSKLSDIVIESNLLGVGSKLPEPMAKSADESVPFRFERKVSGGQHDQIDMRLGKQVHASIIRRREGKVMVVDRVAIGLGEEAGEVVAPGISIKGTLGMLDVDQWRLALRAEDAGVPVFPLLASIDLKAERLDVFSRRFHDVSISGRSKAGRWQGKLAGREFAGELTWQPQGKGKLSARMARFALPAAAESTRAAPSDVFDKPSGYPAIDMQVDDFNYKGKALGRLELAAIPEATDWRIERLTVRSPDASFSADGFWQWQAKTPRTQLAVRLEVADIGKFLTRMGHPEGVRGGSGRLNGTLSWDGAPQDLDFPTLAGHLMVEATRGQFLKLDPGIGKLLSILSLQALPRRVSLDFKDVFSEGFVFDEILGVVKLRRGVGTTDGFRINGSSAKVAMSGEVDFSQETQKLRVRVIPAVGDSVATVTALLGGPVAGIGVFLAQKLLNDPLGQLVAYDYSVTGTWADPQVAKIVIERPQPEPGSG
jgi:uncharacterized protein (TIGR02099 family)